MPKCELLIESAYFIPLGPGVEILRGMVNRGVEIRVLTNSLASNDVLAAFAGYSKVRGRLLASGVKLYEVRPQPGPFPQQAFGALGEIPIVAEQTDDAFTIGGWGAVAQIQMYSYCQAGS
jgi:phosphatidylserine/phosphatidylglycerophosphate/cardiolipin synthase-like enzyme